MREAPRSLTHSDARMSLREHHDEHMRALFGAEGEGACGAECGASDDEDGSLGAYGTERHERPYRNCGPYMNDGPDRQDRPERQDRASGSTGLTDSQVEYLLRVGRVFRSEAPEQSGAKYREYMRQCFPKDAASTVPRDARTNQAACACGGTRRYDAREQQLVCTSCGVSVHDFTIAMPQHGTEESSVVPHFTYKKVNHFREWLAQCQAREMSDLDATVEAVRAELRKQRVSEHEQQNLTPAKVRQYLRALRLGNYDHVHLIHSAITGRRPPQFDHETEMRLVEMFKATLAPFEAVKQRVCPTRSNFLSYSYVLRKLTGLLGIPNVDAHYFPLLKSREKLHQQDMIWQKICAEIGWDFIPSL